jgi:hypothetical protein
LAGVSPRKSSISRTATSSNRRMGP